MLSKQNVPKKQIFFFLIDYLIAMFPSLIEDDNTTQQMVLIFSQVHRRAKQMQNSYISNHPILYVKYGSYFHSQRQCMNKNKKNTTFGGFLLILSHRTG